MKLVKTIPFLLLVAFPASLFAQGGGSNTTTGVSVESAFLGVDNVAAQGGFVGGGRPDAFVGNVDIYRPSTSGSGNRSANTSRLATTTARPRTTASTAQRQTSRALGASQSGNLANQTIRSTTLLDTDMMSPSVPRSVPTLESQLARIQGMQGGQITFTDAPTGATAVLTGTVASDRERRVAAQYLLMQPGINRVDNRLEIR